MKEKSNTQKRYSLEFKEEAVARCAKYGTTQTSKELGIHQGTLNRWKHELKERPEGDASRQKPSYEELEKEVRRLKKEMGYIEEINRVLKKSTAIFASSEMGGIK